MLAYLGSTQCVFSICLFKAVDDVVTLYVFGFFGGFACLCSPTVLAFLGSTLCVFSIWLSKAVDDVVTLYVFGFFGGFVCADLQCLNFLEAHSVYSLSAFLRQLMMW